MKKFITYVSMQPESNLNKLNYKPVDSDDLRADMDVYFPVSVLVGSYAKAGDSVSVICIMEEGNPNIKINFETLKKELESICSGNGVSFDIVPVYTDKEERASSHLKTFKNLIEAIQSKDEIYACCTYGTKPIPVLEMMAMNYAYRVRDNASVNAVVYGKVDREGKKIKGAYLYDITSLFYMNQIVNSLAEQKVKDPDRIMKNLLGIAEDGDMTEE